MVLLLVLLLEAEEAKARAEAEAKTGVAVSTWTRSAVSSTVVQLRFSGLLIGAGASVSCARAACSFALPLFSPYSPVRGACKVCRPRSPSGALVLRAVAFVLDVPCFCY